MEGQRPGSALAFPSLNAAPITPVPLPVVCRFVPHDQWFLTHLAPHWKGRDIKNHILAKCLNLTCTPPEPPTQYSLAEGANREQRPPSPITFAPVPRPRPASPILFATIAPKPASTIVSSEEDDDSWDDDLSIIKSPSDGEGMSDDKGKGRLIDSDDSADENLPPQGGGRVLPTKVPVTEPNKIVPKLRTRASQKKVEDPKAVPQVAHLSFTLMRFSTGQTLEDEYPLSDHNFHPHELLELHLSFSPMRRESRAPTVIPATPNFPFPLLAPPPKQSRSKSKRKQARVHEIAAAHSVRIIRLPRASPQAYVLPYWEGWVRILRLVSRDPDEYYYASSLLNMPNPQGERKVAPGSPQYGTKLNGGHQMGGEKRESSLDANLALNFGLSSKPREHRTRDKQTGQSSGQEKGVLNPSFSAHQHRSHDRAYSRYEWRDRWLVVRDGWFFLLRDRSDTRPTHRYPLSLLYMLRGAERLTDAVHGSAKSNGRPREHSSRPRDPHNHHRSPPPRSSRDNDRTAVPSAAERTRSPSPTSTLKVARARSPVQSGYGHGRHTLGRHTSRPSIAVTDEDAYEEDDERDRRELRTPTNKRPGTGSSHRHHHPHQHHHQHQHPQHRHGSHPHRPEGSRPRRDLTDPATRARLDRDTFIPDSKEEADLVGMKIMCARFYHPTSSGKGRVPDPFDGLQYDEDNSSINNRYTSTAPSLADVTVNIPSGLVTMGIVAVPEDNKDSGGRAKDIKAADNPKHKSRLMSKGSAPSSLSTDFGLPGMSKSLNMTADRRPSLPALMHGGEGLRSNTSVASGSLQTPLNAAANSSTTTLSFTSLFKSSKDKEDRRREKEAKKAAKRADKERREQDQDAPDATTSSGNWKISLPKMRKDARTPTSTLGHGDEEMLIISRHQEEAAVGRNLEPPDANSRRLLDVDSDGSPEPSPVVFRPNPASEDGEEEEDDDDDESIPHFNLNTFSPTSSINQDPSAIVDVGQSDAARVDSGGDDSDSISISSPVFAREDGFEEDDEGSELDFDLGIKQRRTGYRYGGYQKIEGSSSKAPSTAHGSQPSLDEPSTSTTFSPGAASSSRLAGQGSPSTAHPSQAGTERPERPDPQRHRARFEPSVRSSKRKHGEWIIMDFGNDAAFHSLLRILHRHSKELISSSFVDIDLLRQSSRPSSISPRVPSEGISPLSPIPRDLQTNRSHPPSPNRGQSSQNSPVSSIRSRSHSDAPFNPLPRLARSGPFSDDENDINSMRDSPASYQHPGPLYPRHKAPASGDDPTGILNLMPPGIGPYRYPEWRLQAVLRAKRAGLGQEGRPLELIHLAMNEQHSEFYRYNDPAFPRPPNPFRPVKSDRGEESGAAEEEESTKENETEPAKDVDDEKGGEEKAAREDGEADDEQDDDDDDDDDNDEEEQLVFTSESECSDDSELEWQTWTADLPRQYRQRRQRGSSPLWTVPSEFSPIETPLGEEDESDYGIPTTLESENPTIMKQRRLKEPCGVVTSKYTSTALPGFVAQDTEHHDNEEHRYIHRTQRGAPASVSGATLSSPSSGESLAMKYQQTTRPTTGNSVESSTASSPQSSQPHSRGHSHSVSHAIPHKSSRTSNRHSLLHSSSMQTSLRTASDGQGSSPDAGMRKVSMPVMGNTTTTVTEQTFTLNSNSFGMAIQELRNTHDNASIHSHQVPMSSSYGSSSHRDVNASSSNDPFLSTESPISQHRVPSNVSLASGSQHHLRHQSSNFSMGRASNHSSSRPSVLRKNPSDREVERVRKLSNGPLPSSSSSSITPASPPKSPRPKLTVATSPQATSFHQSRGDPYEGPSPPFSPKSKNAFAEGSSGGSRSLGRSTIRRMKSSSSLKSGDEGGGGGEAKGKKKKTSNTFGIFASAFP